MKRDSVEFGGDIDLSSSRVAEARQLRPIKVQRIGAKSIEMMIWALLFVLILLATITLIAFVLMEESGHVHAVLFYPFWLASSPALFFN